MLFPKNDSIIPVFLIDEEPSVLKKGNYNRAMLLGISFEHDELQSFIVKNKEQLITYFITPDLLDRSPTLVQTLKKHKPVVALLGSTYEKYEEDPLLLNKEIETFNSHLGFTPMYFMTEDYMYTKELLNTLFKKQINAIAPSQVYDKDIKLKEGQFVYVALNEETQINWNELQGFINKHKFTSIEETIFDATISSSSSP